MSATLVATGCVAGPYTIIEILPGLRLALLPGEDVQQVAAMWAAHLDETERRPAMADHEPPEWFSQPDEVYRRWDHEDRPLDIARW